MFVVKRMENRRSSVLRCRLPIAGLSVDFRTTRYRYGGVNGSPATGRWFPVARMCGKWEWENRSINPIKFCYAAAVVAVTIRRRWPRWPDIRQIAFYARTSISSSQYVFCPYNCRWKRLLHYVDESRLHNFMWIYIKNLQLQLIYKLRGRFCETKFHFDCVCLNCKIVEKKRRTLNKLFFF